MQVQVNTDDHIEGREELVAQVEATVSSSLRRFSARITRLEIHLSDENGDKNGQNDKRCMMEARLKGRQPTAVTCQAATLDQAIAGAADKLKRSLESTLERLRGHR
jgi:ribosome-associated translation inhibitor RaiA